MKIYRHGDVLLKECALPEEKNVLKESNEVTIALGEATGHHHTLYGSVPIGLFEFDDRRYLQIQEEVELRHQEHHMLKIEPGNYEVIIEREYDYFEETMKKVVD